MTDPTDGWAIATEATAHASKEVVTAAREFGGFISGPLSEVVGILQDHLKVVRFERHIRLRDRVAKFMSDRGLEKPTRQIPLTLGLQILDHATLEEDDDLQDRWAILLVNAVDSDNGAEIRKSFVSILREMSALDAITLEKIASHPEATGEGILTYQLPETAVSTLTRSPLSPSNEMALILWNLARLGCIAPNRLSEGISVRLVSLTPLGKAFVDACSQKRP